MRTRIINDEELQIEELTISNRKLPQLIIKKNEEEAFRKAEKVLSKMLIQMHVKFQDDKEMDIQAFLSMIAIQVIAAYIKLENTMLESDNEIEFYDSRIQSIIDELDNYLGKGEI